MPSDPDPKETTGKSLRTISNASSPPLSQQYTLWNTQAHELPRHLPTFLPIRGAACYQEPAVFLVRLT